MQTFLPYPSFTLSASCLDYRRLGKQRVEADQILNVLLFNTTAWKNHPAVKMWRGYENALRIYRNAMITEWVSRGYKNTMPIFTIVYGEKYPPWLGDEAFHASHRSNLLRKDKEYYSKFGWVEEDNLPYVWPTNVDL